MSAPRSIVPGATYLVTRRTTQRMLMLRPGAEANEIFLYCLAYAAQRTGVEIHGFVQMSNHWHGVVTDPLGRLPEFLQQLHRLVACAMNALLGRVENFWSCEAPSYVRLDDPDDVLDKLAYMAANPVAAGLVEDPREWPGMITTRLGEAHVARRPETYFAKRGMPERVELACTVPPVLRCVGRDEADDQLRRLVRGKVQRAGNNLRAQGRSFLGARGVVEAPLFKAATTRETLRRRRPTFASADPVRRAAARERLRAFRVAYRAAFALWRSGDRSVRFPEGTYVMRVRHGACCGPPSPL
jgi:putative transposase